MTRAALAGALLVAVLVGGFFYGASNAVAHECWPDFG